MELDRRTFLGAAAGSALAMSGVAIGESASACEFAMDDFAGLEGQTFELAGSNIHEQIRLARVRDLSIAEDKDRPKELPKPFSLEFEAPSAERLASGTFAVKHPSLGSCELFLHPVQAENGIVLEAVIS